MTDLQWCREQFPALRLEVDGLPAAFFDGPAGTQVPTRVIDAMTAYLVTSNANARGGFLTSRRTDETLERARSAARLLLGAGDDYAIAFGPNMTTLCFALARAIGRSLKPGDEIVITDMDHEANRDPWLTLERYGVRVRSAPIVPGECRLDLDALESLIGERTKLVAATYAANAVGTVNDAARIVAAARRAGALSLIDAVHYVPHEPVDVDALDCDFIMFSAYKMFGPHVGVLCAKRDVMRELEVDRVRCQSDQFPGSFETGTPNFEGLAGTTAAVEFIASLSGDEECTRSAVIRGLNRARSVEHKLGARLEAGLQSIPGVRMYGPPSGQARVPTYAFTVEGVESPVVSRELGRRGVFTWSGHFYAETLVDRLGVQPGGLVRVGIAPYNTGAEVDRLLEIVSGVAAGRAGVQAGATD